MENYRIHKLIFLKDLNGLKAELSDYTPENPSPEINQLDLHGQTPLTLAITTGFNEAVPILIENGASVLTKNSAGWNPFQGIYTKKLIFKLLGFLFYFILFYFILFYFFFFSFFIIFTLYWYYYIKE